MKNTLSALVAIALGFATYTDANEVHPSQSAQPKATTAKTVQLPAVAAAKPMSKPLPVLQGTNSTLPMGASEGQTVRVLLTPERETTLASTIPARILQLNASLGKSFREGDVLVAFDCEEARARIEMAKAELSSAIDQHEAKVKMQGLQQASDVEVAVAASLVNKNKAQVAMNQSQLSQCSIRAPWSGRVAKVNVRTFMTVTPGQPLMELVKTGPLRLRANFPSKLLRTIKVGTPFNILIDETGQSYQASVHAISGRVDPVSQTIDIEAVLNKEYKDLLPGMSGVADLSSFK